MIIYEQQNQADVQDEGNGTIQVFSVFLITTFLSDHIGMQVGHMLLEISAVCQIQAEMLMIFCFGGHLGSHREFINSIALGSLCHK